MLGQIPGVDPTRLNSCRRISEINEAIICVAHGFPSLAEYHSFASSLQYVAGVRIPLLILNAKNDPVVDYRVLPFDQVARNGNLIMCTTDFGGHLGWTEGTFPFRRSNWSCRVVKEFILGVGRMRYSATNHRGKSK